MKKVMVGLAAGLSLWLWAGLALAQSGAVEIEAGEMEILETDKHAIFRGDVVATRGDETVRCNVMDVTYVDVKQPDGATKTEVDTMICTGNVKVTTPTQVITGDRGNFQLRQDKLLVSGNVTVKQGATVIRGPELVADLKSKKTVMKGGRVKGTFVPK